MRGSILLGVALIMGAQKKRLYTAVNVVPAGDVYALHLDARPLKTPKGREFIVPGKLLAEAIAAEWAAQGEKINPDTMPLTRFATIALDVIVDDRELIEGDLKNFCDTDQLYFRETGDARLQARQNAEIEPIILWAEQFFHIKVMPSYGVIASEQDINSLRILCENIAALTPMQLSAFAVLVNTTASVILAFALLHGRITPAEAANLSQLDEIYQAEKWGVDEEAETARAIRAQEIRCAYDFLRLLQQKY